LRNIIFKKHDFTKIVYWVSFIIIIGFSSLSPEFKLVFLTEVPVLTRYHATPISTTTCYKSQRFLPLQI
jgi:hypothetical protein